MPVWKMGINSVGEGGAELGGFLAESAARLGVRLRRVGDVCVAMEILEEYTLYTVVNARIVGYFKDHFDIKRRLAISTSSLL